MNRVLKEIHVYIDSECEFIYIMPVVRLKAGIWVEALPVEICELVEGERNSVQQLGDAIDRAVQVSQQLAGHERVRHWDGNGEVLWQRNRLFVSVQWFVDGVAVVRQRRVESVDDFPFPGWEDDSDEWLAVDVSVGMIASTVLHYLQ